MLPQAAGGPDVNKVCFDHALTDHALARWVWLLSLGFATDLPLKSALLHVLVHPL